MKIRLLTKLELETGVSASAPLPPHKLMRRFLTTTLAALSLFLTSGRARAQEDQPHSRANNLTCMSCHLDQDIFGHQIGSVAGNANLCQSCHQLGGLASKVPFAESQQARLRPDTATAWSPTGTSHRWDAAVSGRVESVNGTPDNAIMTGGSYTGAYAVSYTITIATTGSVGTARFNWTGTGPGTGSGTGVLTGSGVLLEKGLTVTFANNVALAVGNQWQIFVRPGLNSPTNTDLLSHMSDGKVVCSTCHNSHSQAQEPFDPQAPPYVAGQGEGRHYLREANDTNQLCAECHAGRFVTNALAGSHPVGVLVASNALLHPPNSLPLDKQQGQMWCSTCHDIHNSQGQDGQLLRASSDTQLCSGCHTLADTKTPASHLNTFGGPLWPGGKFGSLMPADTDLTHRGSCGTCHQVHGWPNAASPTSDYPHLLADVEENLCYTCHGSNGPAARLVYADFQRAYRHPVGDTDSLRHAGRSVECTDCHNPHVARARAHVYTNTATALRGYITNTPALLGVSGVVVDYTSLTNYQAPTP
jgi:predicted CXXCH cytochrome family protein